MRMQISKFCVVLLALLLAAMAMIPMVSAAGDDSQKEIITDLIESNVVPGETAQERATITMLDMIQSGALDENWIGAEVNSEPLEIYDVNGELLFYLFSVEKDGTRVGEIYAAASKVLGGPVISIGSVNEQNTIEKLESYSNTARDRFLSENTIISTKVVSFDHPVLGSMFTLKNVKTGKETVAIIDSRDGSVKDIDTQTSSYYHQFSSEDLKENVKAWDEMSARMDEQRNTLLKEQPEILTAYADLDISQLRDLFANARSSGISSSLLLDPDGMNITSGMTHYTQYYSDWCGVATGQIISSKYMSSPWGQYHIGQKMNGYFPNGSPGKGTDIDGELAYYQPSIANGGLGKPNSNWEPSSTSTWENAKKEINTVGPLKIGRVYPSAHARACTGWQVTGGNRYLLFYDPASYGSIYWEYVSPGFTYNNFVYVR